MQIPIKITTEYTLLSSLITLDNLFPALKKNNITVAGICDNNLLGSYLFYKNCLKNDIKPIIGLEIFIDDKSIYLYAKNYNGYKDLLNISYIEQERDLTIFDITKIKDNIIIVLPYESRSFAKEFKDDDLYVSYKTIEEKKNILVTSYKYIHLDDIRAIDEDDLTYLNYLKLIKDGKTIDELSKNDYVSLNTFINSNEEYDYNEFISKIDIKFPEKPNYLPKYQTDKDPFNLLVSLCLKGLNKRLHNEVSDKYKKRLNYELDVIKSMGFVDYFLIVYDYVLYAKKNNISVGPGRGSAAGSLVSYCLGITDVDPLKYNLLFERFLNPKRVTMPDIDIDFEDERRYDIINYVKDKYSFDKVGLVITYGTLGSKQVLRDVARVLNIDESDISKLSKYIDADKDLKDNYTQDVKKLLEENKELKKCYKIASKLYGLKRHTSTHAAGVVISSQDLKDIVPVIKNENELVVGLTKDNLEENGLLKMDFLGLKNLSVIKEIVKIIKDDNKNFDLNNIPLDDNKTYRLLSSGNTKGVFQFETPGMTNLLTKLKPTCFSDLLVAIALFRPGPMDNIDLYIKNKNHPNLIKYPDNSLKDILKETNGIIIYQEQIMQILQFMADYSFAEADNIRRAMSKKKEDIILNEKENFISRSIDKGYHKDVAEDIYNLILKFADYGFNKAHSVAYALIGYSMAYLKANYPDKFILANLNIFGKAQIKCREYLMEALKFHLKLHKPLINKSSNLFIIKGINILLPFNQIVGITEEFANTISSERKENGDYKTIFDFVRRIPLKFINKNNLEKLINADVFRTFGYNKKTLISNLDAILNYAEIANGLSEGEIEEPYLIIEKDYSDKELRLIEKEIYGFYISNHPSSAYQDKVVKIENVSKYFDKLVNMVLVIEKIDTFKTKKSENMASILASDETGEIELVIFPRNINLIDNLDVGDIILVKGNVGRRYNEYQILVNAINRKK